MVRRRIKKKPRFTKKEPSLEQQQKQPTRKRGRPRKTVKPENKDECGGSEDEQHEVKKRINLEARLDDADKKQTVEDSSAAKITASASAAAAAGDAMKEEAKPEEAKPKSRGRRKSQPRKST